MGNYDSGGHGTIVLCRWCLTGDVLFIYPKGAGLQCFFRRTASRPECLTACIHFFILALTGSKSGAKRGWRGKGAPQGGLRMMSAGAISCWRPVVFCKESWAAFAESCNFFVAIVYKPSHSFRIETLNCIWLFSVLYSLVPAKEGGERMRGCKKREKLVSVWL